MKKQCISLRNLFIALLLCISTAFFVCASFFIFSTFNRKDTVTAHAATAVTDPIYWGVNGDTLTFSASAVGGTPNGSFINGVPDSNYLRSICYSTSVCASITKANFADKISFSNTEGLFCNLSNLTEVQNSSNLDMSNVTSMDSMFQNCNSLLQLDVSDWDVSKVTLFGRAFSGCSSLKSLDVSKWNTASGTSFVYIFENCSSLQSIDVSGWDTSNANIISGVFKNCISLTEIDVSGWDTTYVRYFCYLFDGCSKLRYADLSGFDFSKAERIDAMFNGTSAMEVLKLGASAVNCFKNPPSHATIVQNPALPTLNDGNGNTFTDINSLPDSGAMFFTNVKHTHSHKSTDTGIVTPPTCTAQGYTTYTCYMCGESFIADYTRANGHSFTNYVYNDDATCTADGTETAKCDNCAETHTKTKTGSMEPHIQGAHHDAVAATCSQTGNVEYWDCANGCGCKLNSSNQAVSSVITPINPNAHSFTNYVSNDNATCTDNATETAVCDHGCGQTDTREIQGTATGHKWATAWSKDSINHWHVCENSGCTAKGGETAHVYNWVTDTPATLTTTGIQHEECLCGAKRNENTVIPIQTCAHANLTHHDRVEPTCAATGNVEYWYCSDCGKNLDSVNTEIPDITIPIDPTAHIFTNYISDGNATCTQDGTKTAHCAHGCGATDTIADAGSMTDHVYEWVITKQPTTEEEGEKQEKCTVCGHEGEKETIAKLVEDPGGNGNVSDLPPDNDYDLEIAVKESDNLYTVQGVNKGFKVELFVVDGDNKTEYDKEKEVTLTLMIPESMKDNFTLYRRVGDILEKVETDEYTVSGLALSIRTKLPNEYVFNSPSPEEPAAGIPCWVWLIVGLVAVAIVGVIVIIVVVAKKKNGGDEPPAPIIQQGEQYDDSDLKAKLSAQDKKLDELINREQPVGALEQELSDDDLRAYFSDTELKNMVKTGQLSQEDCNRIISGRKK